MNHSPTMSSMQEVSSLLPS